MCRACDLAREEHGFDLAECPAYLRYLDQVDFEEACIQTQDETEARGGPAYRFPHQDEIPF